MKVWFIMNSPEFCKECWKYEECKQKQYMSADTHPVDGYADFDLADLVCEDCLSDKHNCQPMDNCEVDSPAHCSICGVPLNCTLTVEGVEYVKESIKNDTGCCRELWPVLFSDYLD